MSKVAMDRPRYVAFEVQAAAPVSKRAVAQALDAAAKARGLPADAFRVLRYAYPHGIARAPHEAYPALRAILGALGRDPPGPFQARTLSSSGTILALTERLGILTERADASPAPPPRAPARAP